MIALGLFSCWLSLRINQIGQEVKGLATDVARLKEMRKEMNRLVKEAGGLAKEVDRTSRGCSA